MPLKKTCFACGVMVGEEYEYLNEIRKTPEPVIYKGHRFCYACHELFMRRGWFIQELQGKVVKVTFLDMHSFTFSSVRWERIDHNAPVKELRSWCSFFSRLTYSQVHMVKVHSRKQKKTG